MNNKLEVLLIWPRSYAHKAVNCVACDCMVKTWKWARMCKEWKEGNVLVVNARISWGHMEQLPLTLLVAHRLQEQPKAQVQTSGKMKTYGGSRTQRANILNSQIVFCQNSTCSFWTNCPYKERFRHCFVTERKRQWKVREALKAINHKTPCGNIKIWAKDTGGERQLC